MAPTTSDSRTQKRKSSDMGSSAKKKGTSYQEAINVDDDSSSDDETPSAAASSPAARSQKKRAVAAKVTPTKTTGLETEQPETSASSPYVRVTQDTANRPCIVRQELLPLRIAFKHHFDYGVGFCGVTVYQVEHFRFQVRTDREDEELRTLQINVKLVNRAWGEGYNRSNEKEGSDATKVHVLEVQTMGGKTIFRSGDGEEHEVSSGRDGSKLRWETPSSDSIMPSSSLGPVVMKCVSLVFTAIAKDGDNPSRGYMLQQLPSSLRDLCSNFDWRLYFRDRRKKVQFAYRPAKTYGEWLKVIMPRQIEFEDEPTFEYALDEIPWYKKGYWMYDDDSYEYYWDGAWSEAGKEWVVATCWRRVKGAQLRGELVVAQRIYEEPPVWDSDPISPVPVASSHALCVDDGGNVDHATHESFELEFWGEG